MSAEGAIDRFAGSLAGIVMRGWPDPGFSLRS
jgi:hypothetical protein